MKNKIIKIKDSNNQIWWFDGKRLFIPEADQEYQDADIPTIQNGYIVDSLGAALEVLIEEGYLDIIVEDSNEQ